MKKTISKAPGLSVEGEQAVAMILRRVFEYIAYDCITANDGKPMLRRDVIEVVLDADRPAQEVKVWVRMTKPAETLAAPVGIVRSTSSVKEYGCLCGAGIACSSKWAVTKRVLRFIAAHNESCFPVRARRRPTLAQHAALGILEPR